MSIIVERERISQLGLEAIDMRKLNRLFSGVFVVIISTMGIHAANAETSKSTVDRLLAEDAQLSTLWKAIQTAGLEDALKGAGPFTIFCAQ